MYDTASTSYVGNNEISLYGSERMSSSSSSFSSSSATTQLVIQRPQLDVSLSWSDCTMIVQEDNNKHYESSSSLCSLTLPSGSNSSSSSSSSTLSEFSSTSSRMNLQCSDSKSSSSMASRDLSSQRNVRFSQHLEVRTYNLVLGDHPLCQNGLAIENGWEYDSHQGKKIDMVLHEEDCYNSNRRLLRNNISCPRRSHLDRKRLLLEVAGCSEDELNERTNTYLEEHRQREAER